jgi:hypothetical protein
MWAMTVCVEAVKRNKKGPDGDNQARRSFCCFVVAAMFAVVV